MSFPLFQHICHFTTRLPVRPGDNRTSDDNHLRAGAYYSGIVVHSVPRTFTRSPGVSFGGLACPYLLRAGGMSGVSVEH